MRAAGQSPSLLQLGFHEAMAIGEAEVAAVREVMRKRVLALWLSAKAGGEVGNWTSRYGPSS